MSEFLIVCFILITIGLFIINSIMVVDDCEEERPFFETYKFLKEDILHKLSPLGQYIIFPLFIYLPYLYGLLIYSLIVGIIISWTKCLVPGFKFISKPFLAKKENR